MFKDIEYIIKLNPRLVGTPYKEYVEAFLTKCNFYLILS